MSSWEILLIGAALSMDAFAVSITNGLNEPKMRLWKWLMIAFAFALFQFGMPVLGYYGGAVFANLIAGIAPYLSFALLGFIGGKMIFDYASEKRAKLKSTDLKECLSTRSEKGLTFVKLLVQAVATSIDALAVGLTLLAAETAVGLPFHVLLCCTVIGITTFCFSLAGVSIGKKAGSVIQDEAQLAGGLILVFIGVKLLLEGLL